MNASTAGSLLHDLANHSNHSENLKEKLRSTLNNFEKQKNKLKVLRIKYNEALYNYRGYDSDNSNNEDDDDEDETKYHLIYIPNPATDYNIFIRHTMTSLKLANPNMKNTELMTASAHKWNKQKIRIKQSKEKINQNRVNVSKEIVDHKINKDMHKITNLIIGNITGSNFKW